MKLLVVETEPKTRRTYQRDFPDGCGAARKLGIPVGHDGDGQPELLILDIKKPTNGDAATALERVLGHDGSLAVILSSSSPLEDEELKMWSAEACILPSAMLDELKKAIEKQNLSEEDTVLLPDTQLAAVS